MDSPGQDRFRDLSRQDWTRWREKWKREEEWRYVQAEIRESGQCTENTVKKTVQTRGRRDKTGKTNRKHASLIGRHAGRKANSRTIRQVP